MRFFWRACGVCAFYGFVSVAWSCDPTFIAYPHSSLIVRYPYWFFRHVWYLVLCFSCSVCADGSGTGSCRCLAQCCQGGGFFPNSAVFSAGFGVFLVLLRVFALALEFLGCACGVAF